MSSKDDNFWMDDPEWAALREKQNGQPKSKLSRAQRKKLREAQFQAELKAQQAKVGQGAQALTSQARAYMDAARPSSRYATGPSAGSPAKSSYESSRRAPAATPTSTDSNKKVNVSLNVTLPHVDVVKIQRTITGKIVKFTPELIKTQIKKRSKKQLLIGAAAMSMLVIGMLGIFPLTGSKSTTKGNDKGVLAEQSVKIDFKPLLPNGKVDQTTAHKAAKDGQGRPIYTFTDKIGLADLTVSEQPLPESFKANPDTELEKMAKDLYLTEVINQSNPKAYLGTSIKGPQTVIFTKNGLLVFIQSQSKLEKDQWSDYVTRLIP